MTAKKPLMYRIFDTWDTGYNTNVRYIADLVAVVLMSTQMPGSLRGKKKSYVKMAAIACAIFVALTNIKIYMAGLLKMPGRGMLMKIPVMMLGLSSSILGALEFNRNLVRRRELGMS